MADENIEKPKAVEEVPSPEANDLFRKMSEIAPLRDAELEDEDFEKDRDDDEHGTLEERIDSGRKLTDFQTLSNILNPNFGFTHLNLVAMGRTFPDIYNPYFRILLKDLIKNSNLSVAEAIAYANTALSKSIDGEGIIDNIVAYTKGNKEATTEQNKGVAL